MDQQERWQLTGTGPENYEQYQVPSVFEPLARTFLDRVPIERGHRVLDVACGTGIVARLSAPLVGDTGRITGIDLNAGMIDVARQFVPAEGPQIEWRQGDASALPFDDAQFDIVLCQQGLQFVPDPALALREMYRVLAPGGWLALCVWRTVDHSPCNLACMDALKRHVGEDVAEKLRAPFELGDDDRLRDLISEAGFSDVAIRQADVTRRMLEPALSVPGHLASTPVGPDLAALDDRTRQALIDDIADALAPYVSDGGLAVPQGTHLVLACK